MSITTDECINMIKRMRADQEILEEFLNNHDDRWKPLPLTVNVINNCEHVEVTADKECNGVITVNIKERSE